MSDILDRPATIANTVCFENDGEIDITAISTFGVSVKEGDNPIGFFGTGLKYAIAVLLRNKHQITIWSGLEKIEFSTQTTSVRGQDFDLVAINGERAGFTTQVGKTWEMWMAYRELYCNVRDEGGDAYVLKSPAQPQPGKTIIIVKGEAFRQVHGERWKYFVEDAPDYETPEVDVWDRETTSFFYRGVRVHRFSGMAMLTYNLKSKMDLTEDRTAKNAYQVTVAMVRAVMSLTDERVLKRVLTAPEQFIESNLDYHGWGIIPSQEFMSVVGQLVNAGDKRLNKTAKRVWVDVHPTEIEPREIAMTSVQRQTLERALDFCGKIGIRVRNAYPILIVETLGEGILGEAKSGKIYVAEIAFQMGGAKQVAATLIEEFVHLRYGYVDCERPMQNWLFEKMVSLGEELTGAPL